MKHFQFADGIAPIEIGQTVAITNGQHEKRERVREVTITRIGRELVHLSDKSTFSFKGQARNTIGSVKLYSSLDAYNRAKRQTRIRQAIIHEIREKLDSLNGTELHAIAEILDFDLNTIEDEN